MPEVRATCLPASSFDISDCNLRSVRTNFFSCNTKSCATKVLPNEHSFELGCAPPPVAQNRFNRLVASSGGDGLDPFLSSEARKRRVCPHRRVASFRSGLQQSFW